MLKNLFDKGKCLLGLHQGDWAFVAPDSCEQSRTCRVCGAVGIRTEHGWSDWSAPNKRCESSRNCERCHEKERKVEHSWDWWHPQDGDCTQVQRCTRCSAIGDERWVAHEWGAWAYDESCRAPVRNCQRCAARASAMARQVLPRTAGGLRVVGEARPSTPHAKDAPAADESIVKAAFESQDPRVLEVIRLFVASDGTARRKFAEGCPDAPIKEQAVALVAQDPEFALMGLNMLGIAYCRGRDADLAIVLSRAALSISYASYARRRSDNDLTVSGMAAMNLVTALGALGRNQELIAFAGSAVPWLITRGQRNPCISIMLSTIESYLRLDDLTTAGELLDKAETVEIPPELPAERQRLVNLRKRFGDLARRKVTDLPPPATTPHESRAESRRSLEGDVRALRELAKQGGLELPKGMLEELEGEVQRKGSESDSEWMTRTQPLLDRMTEFVSGATGTADQQNDGRIRDASVIFADPVRGNDPQAIGQSLGVLKEALEWARAHQAIQQENDALWGLYLCYSRTGRDPDAIIALQALRASLERRRSGIVDPMERAGVLRQYPSLFEDLCVLLCRNERWEELLDAIEGAKGRVLAEILAKKQGHAVPDESSSSAASTLAPLLAAARAHYLSFLVTAEESFAVLVAKDGTLHGQRIALGGDTLRRWAQSVDPRTWTNARGGVFAEPIADLPERLASLVSWLKPLAETGVFAAGDHLCYCPDKALHLIPLHFVAFLGEPLVRHVSVSRIHGAVALATLLGRPATKPSAFVAAHVPAQQDLGDAAKLAALERTPRWLAKNLPGITLARTRATLKALTPLDLTGKVVHFATHGTFPLRDSGERNPNPFYASGLALARNRALPSLTLIASGKADDALLSPARVLDLDLADSHVTLQACVSGLAKDGLGGDALGLELGFLLARAQSVLSTHWNVSVDSSADFAIRFYRQWLVDGATRAAAWRDAVVELMQRPSEEGIAPEYHWAGFSLSGDWR